MVPNRWKEIEDLYQAALKLEPSGRDALLASASPELRREVAALLAPDDPSSATETVLEPLSYLGPYKIEAKIGEGGMGEVYHAYDTRLRRKVAVKILPHDKGADPASQQRFLREARAASALNHPNIVTIHDIAKDNGVDYLVMELVPGRTLKQMIAPGPLPLADLVEYGVQITSALAAAHAAGIVHRDIKPANIMVTPERQVKILDFGIAKRTPLAGDGQAQTEMLGTMPGMVVGTVAYMSPEQTRGEPVDGRSDIFSLGCVLYQAATGRLPFRGESTLAMMHEIAVAQPPPPSGLNPQLPAGFDRLIAMCMEKSADRRLANAAELTTELKELVSAPAPAAPHVQAGRVAVAVVPFRLRTGNQEDEFLSVALADATIHRLSSTGKLLVRPIESVLRYKDSGAEWTRVARDLNVDVVVQGVIQKMGPKVRVLVEALRVSDSGTLHSSKHDGDVDDLFTLQDRVADAVSDVFVTQRTGAMEAAEPPTRNAEAYQLYLRAVDRMAHPDKFDTGVAIQTFERVVELDPNFADAWGRLAQACARMENHLDPDPRWLERAEQAIAKTLDLDPVHGDALCARGMILWSPSRGFQNRAALRALNASLKVNPNRDSARDVRGAILFHLGFYRQASIDLQESTAVNPDFILGYIGQAAVAQYTGDYERARDVFDRALSLNPSALAAHVFGPVPDILLGRLDVARAKIARSRQIVPEEPGLIAQEGLVLAHEGNFRAAEDKADEAVGSKQSLTHTHHTWHNAAGVYALCGKPEKAVLELRRCAEMGLPNYDLFRTDPHLQGLRGYPDFEALLTQLRRAHDAIAVEFGLTGETGASTSRLV